MPQPARLRQIMDEISARLQPVCTRMSTDEFSAMVDEMAGVQYKYERRARSEAVSMFMRRSAAGSDDLDGTLG